MFTMTHFMVIGKHLCVAIALGTATVACHSINVKLPNHHLQSKVSDCSEGNDQIMLTLF